MGLAGGLHAKAKQREVRDQFRGQALQRAKQSQPHEPMATQSRRGHVHVRPALVPFSGNSGALEWGR